MKDTNENAKIETLSLGSLKRCRADKLSSSAGCLSLTIIGLRTRMIPTADLHDSVARRAVYAERSKHMSYYDANFTYFTSCPVSRV
jgi:hypothetical protein